MKTNLIKNLTVLAVCAAMAGAASVASADRWHHDYYRPVVRVHDRVGFGLHVGIGLDPVYVAPPCERVVTPVVVPEVVIGSRWHRDVIVREGRWHGRRW